MKKFKAILIVSFIFGTFFTFVALVCNALGITGRGFPSGTKPWQEIILMFPVFCLIVFIFCLIGGRKKK